MSLGVEYIISNYLGMQYVVGLAELIYKAAKVLKTISANFLMRCI